MQIANNNVIARVAAVVAGLGLVAMSFASFAPAAKAADTSADLQAQISALLAQIAALQAGGTVAASTTFTRDLTIGASGADVTALQNWLIKGGFAIPAGATGYFGAQTAAALGKYQASVGISPAAGYFGPITRAKVNASAGTGTGTGTGTSTGGLSGGESDIDNSYDLVSGDDLMEGDSDTEIAIARFTVKGGDARLQRVTIDAQATNSSYSEKPWDYIDTLSIYNGSKKVGEVDAGSKSDWDKEDNDSNHASTTADFYTLDIAVDTIVEEGDKAELSIRADAQSSIDDSDESQTFSLQIPEDGIRAVDAKGIQQYTGSNTDRVTVGFDA
ncbi:MAG: peptidoglycan-binding protein, partial [Patescibacteria group bacterium]